MCLTVRHISLPGSDGADSREDLLCESNHQTAEQAQEALGSLAGVMALDRHADLDDAPAEDNNQSVRTLHTDMKILARLEVGFFIQFLPPL